MTSPERRLAWPTLTTNRKLRLSPCRIHQLRIARPGRLALTAGNGRKAISECNAAMYALPFKWFMPTNHRLPLRSKRGVEGGANGFNFVRQIRVLRTWERVDA